MLGKLLRVFLVVVFLAISAVIFIIFPSDKELSNLENSMENLSNELSKPEVKKSLETIADAGMALILNSAELVGGGAYADHVCGDQSYTELLNERKKELSEKDWKTFEKRFYVGWNKEKKLHDTNPQLFDTMNAMQTRCQKFEQEK